MKTGTKVGNNVITAALLCVHALSYLTFVTAGTVDCQAPLSMEFTRQEYWSELPLPTPKILGIFSTQGSNPHLLHWKVDSLPLHHLGNPTSECPL